MTRIKGVLGIEGMIQRPSLPHSHISTRFSRQVHGESLHFTRRLPRRTSFPHAPARLRRCHPVYACAQQGPCCVMIIRLELDETPQQVVRDFTAHWNSRAKQLVIGTGTGDHQPCCGVAFYIHRVVYEILVKEWYHRFTHVPASQNLDELGAWSLVSYSGLTNPFVTPSLSPRIRVNLPRQV